MIGYVAYSIMYVSLLFSPYLTSSFRHYVNVFVLIKFSQKTGVLP